MLPPIQLEPTSETPLYRQLYEQLKGYIEAGRMVAGERLPATREMAGQLGLNRATVSAAYELLENEGLLKGHVGRGSFVASVKVKAGRSGDSAYPALPALALGPEGISFASSRPGDDLFPLAEFREACAEVIGGQEVKPILQLGSPLGYGPLREYLAGEAKREGAMRGSDEVMITSGCQQAMDLLQRVMLEPGDVVVVEEPLYPGVRSVLAAAGAKLVGVPVGEDGMDMAVLERVLRGERPRMLVVTPNFQNPTGATMGIGGRRELLRLVKDTETVVVENDIYGQLRYRGAGLPTLKELDDTGSVVLLRSFSKIAFPGLRVGWVIGPKGIVRRLQEAKQWSDLHSDQLSQAVLQRFAVTGRLARHRERVCKAGLERLLVVLRACQTYLPEGSTWTEPDGGMNLWVRLPEPLDAGELLPRAERAQVNYLPGKYFAVTRSEAGALRLSFAGLTPTQIERGVALLGEVFAGELERVRKMREMAPATALV